MKKTIYTIESKTFITWLKLQRNNAGLTQRELAVLLDIHHSIVGKIETGERRLDVVEFIEYCQQLNADLHSVIEMIRGVK